LLGCPEIQVNYKIFFLPPRLPVVLRDALQSHRKLLLARCFVLQP
jgi:hypothetical protein